MWCPPAGPSRCPTTGRWPGWRSASCPPAGSAGGSRKAGSTCCTCTSRPRPACPCWPAGWRARGWVREGGLDVLHVREPAAPSLSLLACWVADGPIVATVHTATTRSRVMHAAYPALQTALEKITGRIAVSEAARTTLVEHMGGDAVLIPNGVTVSRYEKATPLPGWPGEGGAIGFLGRMDEPRKGLDVLLRAVAELGVQRP